MSIKLRCSKDLSDVDHKLMWYSVTGTSASLHPEKRLLDIGARLEKSFDNIRDEWWRIGKKIGGTPTANLAHMPTAASYNCDFGLMLAWVRLTTELSKKKESYVVICDDPWLFRQLKEIDGVSSGRLPRLWPHKLGLYVRGYLARIKLITHILFALFYLRGTRPNPERGSKTLVVYAHPGSSPDGADIYFGSLMEEIPSLKRVIHTDGDVKIVKQLSGERTSGLHVWGSVLYIPSLLFKRWMPSDSDLDTSFSWLVRRSCTRENSTAAPAANAWQIHCQGNWIRENKPEILLWPWENHPWERELCRQARRLFVKTIGYQHAVIGPQQFNPGPASNSDGLKSIPDRIIFSGPAYYEQLISWGMPKERMIVGGAFRIAKLEENLFDPGGPIFVAASSDTDITRKLMLAVNKAQRKGRKFIVKTHPLYPKQIKETGSIKITNKTIPAQKGISAVFYGTGTSGLEGMLARVPTFRLRPDDQVAINVLPNGVHPVPVSIESLDLALNNLVQPPSLEWDTIFADVIPEVWKNELEII